MSRPIVVYGAGGHGREVAALIGALATEGWELHGWLDDDRGAWQRTIAGAPVLGDGEWLRGRRDVAVAMGIGNPERRKAAVGRITGFSPAFPALVDPAARIMARSVVGQGTVVMAGAIISVDSVLGAFCCLNLRATVNHDCRLGDFGTLGPAAALAGAVTLGAGAELGAGATCIPGTTVGEWSMIGAGAVVISDIPPRRTAVGVPAHLLP